jgi:hypothetical protein
LVQLYDSVFAELGLNGVTIKINNLSKVWIH